MALGKQVTMFGAVEEEEKYTKTIKAPIYKTKNKRPHIMELCNKKKMIELLIKINESGVSEDEKDFLRLGCQRHLVFNYEVIADYYAHADAEMQDLMEDSALVIIDFEKAIEHGYMKLNKDIKEQYLEEQYEE